MFRLKHSAFVSAIVMGSLMASAADAPPEAQCRALIRQSLASKNTQVRLTYTLEQSIRGSSTSRDEVEATLRKALRIKELPDGTPESDAERERLRVSVDSIMKEATTPTRLFRQCVSLDGTSWRLDYVEGADGRYPATNANWTASTIVDRGAANPQVVTIDHVSKRFVVQPNTMKFSPPPIDDVFGFPAAIKGAIRGAVAKSLGLKSIDDLPKEPSDSLFETALSQIREGTFSVRIDVSPEAAEPNRLLVNLSLPHLGGKEWITAKTAADDLSRVYELTIKDPVSGQVVLHRTIAAFDEAGWPLRVMIESVSPDGKRSEARVYSVEDVLTIPAGSAVKEKWFSLPDGYHWESHRTVAPGVVSQEATPGRSK